MMEFKVGDVFNYHTTGGMIHKVIVTAVWEYEGRKGISFRPVGNYGFEVEYYLDTIQSKISK